MVLNSVRVSFIVAVLPGSLIHMLVRKLSVKWYIKASLHFSPLNLGLVIPFVKTCEPRPDLVGGSGNSGGDGGVRVWRELADALYSMPSVASAFCLLDVLAL